jgi:hypothetical protein
MSPSESRPIQAKSFFVVLSDKPCTVDERALRKALGDETCAQTLVSPDRRMLVGFIPRVGSSLMSPFVIAEGKLVLALGDTSEFDLAQATTPMANGALIEIDLEAKSVRATASIVGLPPLFLHEGDGKIILASNLFCLSQLLPLEMHFDPEGVLDLCMYGFPIEHRTLFRGVCLVPGGSSLHISVRTPVEFKCAWEFRASEPLAEWGSYTELQIEAFLSALRRMDLSHSFLSLTAGLDTRTILAALLNAGRSVSAYTLSGETESLDAQIARALCEAYGVSHGIISLDGDFLRDLADCTVQASCLSGGLSSLGQAHQVYLYRKLPGSFIGRVSGNMGNQLGRQGVEHVTMRAADPIVLSPELQKRAHQRSRFAWTNQQTGGLPTTSHEFLFQQEFVFTQVGNYSVGDFFAVQQSPYASRDLIALCYRQPRQSTKTSMSPARLRLKDLHHRFLGEPETYSFQRRLIHRIGGLVASYPINWGWRAKGGISLAGAFRGGLAIVDAYTERAGWDSGAVGRVLRALHVTGLHEHRKPKRWLRDSLRDFVQDTLRSAESQACGILDTKIVGRMLDEHYSDRGSHHRSLVLALDLALAAKNFRATLP